MVIVGRRSQLSGDLANSLTCRGEGISASNAQQTFEGKCGSGCTKKVTFHPLNLETLTASYLVGLR